MSRNRSSRINQQKHDTTSICSVCFTADPPEKARPNNGKPTINQLQRKKIFQQLRCTQCKLKVHRHCYDPSINQSKYFKCDVCSIPNLKKNSSKKSCFICLNDFGMLKRIEQNKFAHIHCALTSQQLILQNFKTLKFIPNPNYKQKDKNSKQKSTNNNKCSKCNNGPDAVINCMKKGCTFSRHIICLIKDKFQNFESNFNDIIFNLLTQTQYSFRVKNQQFLKSNQKALKGISLLSKSNRTIPLITCHLDNQKFIWCIDCKQIGNVQDTVQCVKCLRWVHQQCSKMKNKSQTSYFECNACVNNKIFLKRYHFPQLIYSMVQFQTSQSPFIQQNVKFIDCFPFRCSNQLYSVLLKNSAVFQKYILSQHLQKQLLFQQFRHQKIQTLNNNKLYEMIKQKKFIEIVYYLKFNQQKRLNQITIEDINKLRDLYPMNTKRKSNKIDEENKCKAVFDKLLDVSVGFIKKNQFKNLTIKIVQLGDKLRKEILLIKDKQIGAQNSGQSQNNSKNNSRNFTAIQDNLLKQLKVRPSQIALDIRETLKLINDFKDKFKPSDFQYLSMIKQNEQENLNKQKSTSKNKINIYGSNDFLLTLIRCILTKDQHYPNQSICVEDLEQLIEFYRKIIFIITISNISKPLKLFNLSETQYYKITNKTFNLSKTMLSDLSRINIRKYFKSLLKDNKIKYPFQSKAQITEKYDQMIQNDTLNYNQIQIIKSNISQQGLFVDRHSKILIQQKRTLYYKALKLKYLKLIKFQLEKENQINDKLLIVNEKSKKEICDNIKRILEADNKTLKLSQQEKNMFQYYLIKQQVYVNILKEQTILGSKLNQYPIQRIINNNVSQTPIVQEYNQNNQNIQTEPKNINKIIVDPKQATAFERIKRIFSYWKNHSIRDSYRVMCLIYPIAQKKIKFTVQQQCAFDDLIDSLGQRYNMEFQNNRQIKSQQFNKLWKLIEYSSLQNSYPKIKQLYQDYSRWLQDLEVRFTPIQKVLQDKFRNSQILQVIDRKIKEAQNFQIDLKLQVKKLKLVKLWAVLSQKFIKQFQKKPTINAVQQFKGLMQKINYPHNQIYKKVIQLDNHGKQLNTKISKYLQKQKYDQMEAYQEYNLINSKMSIQQANQLKQALQNSSLDVSAQLQELEEQLEGHSLIPLKLDSYFKKNSLQQLLTIRKKIIQTPFKYQNMEGYYNLITKIYQLKCQNIQGTVNKRQFFKILNYSGLGSNTLIDKFPNLLKTYKQIQKAQKQVLSSKPKFQNLLPVDNKRLKSQLIYDPIQKAQIQKTYQKYQYLYQKFKGYKNSKVQYERYLSLENQLSHLPINWKHISEQIARMKMQIDSLLRRTRQIKNNFDPKQASNICSKYKKIPIKNSELDDLCRINDAYKKCQQLGQMAFDEQHKYPQFSQRCRQVPQLSHLSALDEIRCQLFQTLSDKYLTTQHIQINILNILLHQGSHLCKLSENKINRKQRRKILQKLLKIDMKIDELMKRKQQKYKNKRASAQSNSNDYDQQQQDSDEHDYDDQMQNQDSQDYGQQYLDDQDQEDQQSEIDQDPSQHQHQRIAQNKKRLKPQVMQISDQQQAAPMPKKHIHTSQNNQSRLQQKIILENQENQNIKQNSEAQQ